VTTPSHDMLAQIVQRGVDRGEFRAINVIDVVHALVAPMIFLVMHKHSLGACAVGHAIDAKSFIAAQTDLVLHGLEAPKPPAPATARRSVGKHR
jgi:hypothetical protein